MADIKAVAADAAAAAADDKANEALLWTTLHDAAPRTDDVSEVDCAVAFWSARRNFARALALASAPLGATDAIAYTASHGVEAIACTRKATFYNAILRVDATQSAPDLDAGVRDVSAAFARAHAPVLTMLVARDSTPAVVAALQRAGGLYAFGNTRKGSALMRVDLDAPDTRVAYERAASYIRHVQTPTPLPGSVPPVPGATGDRFAVVEVRDDEVDRKRQWGETLMTGFAMPRCDIAWHGRVWAQAPVWGSAAGRRAHMRLFAAVDLHVPGTPVVSTAMLAFGDGCCAVFNVATPTPYRGFGLGTALSAHCMLMGKTMGYRWCVLQPSAAGTPVYRKLTFKFQTDPAANCVGLMRVGHVSPVLRLADAYFARVGGATARTAVGLLVLVLVAVVLFVWALLRALRG